MKRGSFNFENMSTFKSSQYSGEAQPYEDFEADILEMQENKKLDDTPTTSAQKKKRQYRRKLTYSSTSTPKKKLFKPSEKILRAPTKPVNIFIKIGSKFSYKFTKI